MEPIDRAAIFLNLCVRQKIRREARLPLLDLKAEYHASIAAAEAARLRAIREPYESQVRAEILNEMRAIYGPHWPSDSGGRWMLMGLVRKESLSGLGFDLAKCCKSITQEANTQSASKRLMAAHRAPLTLPGRFPPAQFEEGAHSRRS